jgi:hypothetical protein
MRTRKTLFAFLFTLGLSFCLLTPLQAASASRPLISAKVTGTSVTLSYNSTSKVNGYEVSMATGSSASSKVVYTGTKTSFTVTKLTLGSTLVFQVRSYVEVKKVRTYSDPVSLTVEVNVAVPVLKGTLSKSVANLSWAKVPGAQGYEVVRSTVYAGPYTLVKTAATPKFSEKLKLGTKVYYKIRAYVTINGKRVYSDFSNIILISN